MPLQLINVGSAPDDGTGDPIRTAGIKCNDNFTELYAEDASLDGRVTALEGAPGSVAELDDVGDVNAPTPANGDVLTWDSTPGEWVAAAPTGGSNALDDLTDVDAPTPSDGDVLTFDSGSGDWVPAAPSGGGAIAVIGTQVLSSAAATIDFSSIPGSYEDLVLVLQGRGTAAANSASVQVRFNGDTGANYHYSEWNRFGNSSNAAQTSGRVGAIVAASATANYASGLVLTIPNYKRTTFFKGAHATNDVSINATAGGQFPQIVSAEWASIAAINQVTLLLSSGNFDTGTVATLYGRG